MPRELRIQYPGAMYHVLNRGDQREDIFLDDEDRQRFLTTLGETCGKTDWQVHTRASRNDMTFSSESNGGLSFILF